jgi:hypothetical protein
VLDNIAGLQSALSKVIKGPSQQALIDQDYLTTKTETNQDILEGMVHQERVGTLYARLSHKPELFGSKDDLPELFKDAAWVSVSSMEGCWICHSVHTRKLMNS